ncbi:MAG: hypothetical protein HC812_06160 [Leptolyngbya sp. RL_3_1]|nr:hypothetical protein [Leptolyngbya sp. RL_3_1]
MEGHWHWTGNQWMMAEAPLQTAADQVINL